MRRILIPAALLFGLLTFGNVMSAGDRPAPFDSDDWAAISDSSVEHAVEESASTTDQQIFPVQALADSPGFPSSTPPVAQPWSFDEYTPFIQRFGLAHDEGQGIGFDQGFTTLEWMTPITGDFEWALLFADGRVLVRNDGTVGANFGIAHRYYDLNWNRIFGANVFYDYRNTEDNHFHQLGLGLEWLGEIVDVRANAYIPDVDNVRGPIPNLFRGHQLIINRDEVAMTGGDVELGLRLPTFESIQVEVFGGFYHFDGHGNDDATGWRTRAQAEIAQRVTLDVAVQNDDVFGTTATFGVALQYLHRFLPPYTQAARSMDHKFFRRPQDVASGNIAYRLGEPIERLQNIVLSQQPKVATDAAGVPLNFLHVVEGGAGDGTFETPYGTLSAAMADADAGTSITYTPFGGAYVENVALVAGATILSNGPEQFVTSQCGATLLPFSGTSTDLSMIPTLTGNVTLADNTRFSGFDVTGGVSGTGLVDVTGDNSVISNSLGDAVDLMNVDGATLTNLIVSSTAGRGILLDDTSATLTDVNITLAADDGIEINSAAVDRTVEITNLTVDSAFTEGVDINLDGAGNLAVSFAGTNSITAADNAVDATLGAASTGDLDLSLTGTTLASTAGAGEHRWHSRGRDPLHLSTGRHDRDSGCTRRPAGRYGHV
ncbi:MAG: inverse autotransporter beta domain-containing protein [Planctomycetaceae bacterium]